MARFDELEQARLAAALARAQDACDGLGDDSPLRSKLQAFLSALAPKLQFDRARRGDKPSMRAARLDRHDADRRPDGDPRKAPREAAFDRLAELLEAGWPPLTMTEMRQQKAQRLADSDGARTPCRRIAARTDGFTILDKVRCLGLARGATKRAQCDLSRRTH